MTLWARKPFWNGSQMIKFNLERKKDLLEHFPSLLMNSAPLHLAHLVWSVSWHDLHCLSDLVHTAGSGTRMTIAHGHLTRYAKLWVAMRRECRGRFPRHRLQRKPLASDGVRDAPAVMPVGIAKPRWRGKRSRHSRRMHNPQFRVSDKRPVAGTTSLVPCH